MILEVKTFRMDCTDKEQAVKVLEEAAEVFAALQKLESYAVLADYMIDAADSLESAEAIENASREDLKSFECDLADEIADVIQAACNLAARYDLDMAAAMERCEQRNRERGRYE